jgi:hypothetical protein
MIKEDLQNNNSVSLMFAFKVALDQEDYLLCKDIKEELINRKRRGELNNEVITATVSAYNIKGADYKDMQYKVFTEMLTEIKNI